MARVGTLAKLKTREKKFEPIAAHLNAIHHFQDNVSFPWEWSWRDLSVKIQNMPTKTTSPPEHRATNHTILMNEQQAN